MDKVKIGVVGLGSFCSGYHVPNLLNRSDVEVTAVCDNSQECLDGRNRGLRDSRTFTDYRDMIDPDLIDGVFVSTPNRAHFDPCKLALERGIPAIVDKPITVTVEDAEELVALSESQKLHFDDGVHAPFYVEYGVRAQTNRFWCDHSANAHGCPEEESRQARYRRRGHVAPTHDSHYRCFAVAYGQARGQSRGQNSIRDRAH